MHKYRIVTLDKRHKGYGKFSHFVDFMDPSVHVGHLVQVSDFVKTRNWCWEVWGPAQEIDFTPFSSESKWAWWRDELYMKLYFNTPAETSTYVLQFQ